MILSHDANPGRIEFSERTTPSIRADLVFGSDSRQAAVIAARPAELDRHVLTLDETTLLKAAAERFEQVHGVLRRPGAHESDHWHRRLLPKRRERPRPRC